uniref:Uncharacterized protein n=1 Tax=Manihot esculenta TaxID=3983 RepID=A0A2C9WEZ8_MANES
MISEGIFRFFASVWFQILSILYLIKWIDLIKQLGAVCLIFGLGENVFGVKYFPTI